MAAVMAMMAVVAMVTVVAVMMMVPAAERFAEQRGARADRKTGHQTVGHGGARARARTAVDDDWRRLDGVRDRLSENRHDGLPVHDWLRVHGSGRRIRHRMGHWHGHGRRSTVSGHGHGSGAVAVCSVNDWLRLDRLLLRLKRLLLLRLKRWLLLVIPGVLICGHRTLLQRLSVLLIILTAGWVLAGRGGRRAILRRLLLMLLLRRRLLPLGILLLSLRRRLLLLLRIVLVARHWSSRLVLHRRSRRLVACAGLGLLIV